MENQYQKYRFSAISIKKEVADRFRKFSRELSLSNTDTMEAMLNFFSYNNLLPSDDLGIKSDTTRKRINALIAIVRNIEKQQTLESLLRQIERTEKKQEKLDFSFPDEDAQSIAIRIQEVVEEQPSELVDSEETIEKPKPIHDWSSHPCDAVRYAIYTHQKMSNISIYA